MPTPAPTTKPKSLSMPFGALPLPGGGALFRLWAPGAARVELLRHADGDDALVCDVARSDDGWCEHHAADAQPGERYRWRIDGATAVPDPASRFNPDGPHGASELIDPAAFVWDADAAGDAWPGRPWHEAVFYQLHVGAFTPEGSYAAAAHKLPELAALGITAVQLMPLADFPGAFGWGYDGVLPFAPFHGYGRPDDLKAFVQAAHRLGLMVFGDVVYNHFGPDGNFLHAYAPQFFSQRHQTAWGAGLNFDGDGSDTVREFFVANALYWIEEFRFDGLRLDAVHAMRDERRPHILEALSARVRERCDGRHVHLVLENDANEPRRLAAPGASGRASRAGRYDGQWSGDVHHPLHVLLTGEHDGYYAEYDAPIEQLGRALAHGFSRQGGPHNCAGAAPRGPAEGNAPLGAIVNLLQNHDQIGNRAFGERLLQIADPAAVRLAAAIVCLNPSTPLLFMGEEFGATTPFLYVADWQGDLGEAVRDGRRKEFAEFPRYAEAALAGRLPDPCSRASFEASRLDWAAAAAADGQEWRRFYTELLQLRMQRLVPWWPDLMLAGHGARADGTLLQLQWRFERYGGKRGSGSGGVDARLLQMRVNLSAQPASSAAPQPSGGQSELIYAIGEIGASGASAASGPSGTSGSSDTLDAAAQHGATRFGPWSGQWHWLPAPPGDGTARGGDAG